MGSNQRQYHFDMDHASPLATIWLHWNSNAVYIRGSSEQILYEWYTRNKKVSQVDISYKEMAFFLLA